MGWLYEQIPAGTKTTEYVAKQFAPNEVLEAKLVGKTVYAAVKLADETVLAAVVLVDRRGGEIGTKIMDETVGPYQYQCPATILAKLTPPFNELAAEWREKCQAQLAPGALVAVF